MFTRGFTFWGDNDWLTTRVDKWVAQCHGYSKLRNRRLSKGCQTMLDRPSPQKLFWSRSDSELLNELPDNIPNDNDNVPVSVSSLSLDEVKTTEDDNRLPSSAERLQYDRDIAEYIAYLNKPIINMNDHYIEIHQYHYEPSNFEVPIRPPTRRKKHRIDLKKTEIVDHTGISSVKTPEYSEFLVKKTSTPDINQNIKVVIDRTSDEENRNPKDQGLDHHRPLAQASASTADNRVDTVVSKEANDQFKVKVTRGQTFNARSSGEESSRGFMSFRTTRKNKSGRRKKKVVVGENGINGPIWPAVLLTFDRSISPGLPESPDESEV